MEIIIRCKTLLNTLHKNGMLDFGPTSVTIEHTRMSNLRDSIHLDTLPYQDLEVQIKGQIL